MIELGELESHYAEFEKRRTRVVVISLEDQATAKETQSQFPHLLVVADDQRKMADAIEVIHRDSNPSGGDTTAPTTILVDGSGKVRWTFRPDRYLTRLTPEKVLAAVDEHLAAEKKR
ncbi:MAG TPA: redoxin domain-containing protein [Gemmataceae bacterium]|nr:redoxin domain-containing protein [Gemmataceae bacterium]